MYAVTYFLLSKVTLLLARVTNVTFTIQLFTVCASVLALHGVQALGQALGVRGTGPASRPTAGIGEPFCN